MERKESTKLLIEELKSANPSEEKIRKFVAAGADIGWDFLKEMIQALMPPHDHLGKFYGKVPDLKLFQLLIDLGADINYKADGFNCLYDAALAWQPDLVELFLKAGANPNCISDETPESFLDWVENDMWHEEGNIGGDEILPKIIELLKSYGAKGLRELDEWPQNS